MKDKLAQKYKIAIAFHETLPCFVAEYLKTYLLDKYSVDLLFIGHPLLDVKESYQRNSRYEYYKNSKLYLSKNAFHWMAPKPILFVKDMFYTFMWCLKFNGKWEAFFGMDNINVLVALFLKKMGRIKKVVYHTIDYYPTRFPNKFLNWLYFQFDKICVKYADETWNISEVMVEARRKKMGMSGDDYKRQYTFPICVWVDKVKRKPFDKINKKKIIYRGSLVKETGVDLMIKAMPSVLKFIPDAVLEIFGDGVEREYLEREAKKLKVTKHVKFYGWIRERKKLESLMSDGALGIATFNTRIIDDKVRNADPGKIKDYMLMGMPVITTNVVSNCKQIKDQKCGLVIDYNIKDLSAAVIRLLSDEVLLRQYRNNALKFIKQFDCGKLFDENIGRVLA